MNTNVESAIIAATVSLIVSLIGFISSTLKLRAQREQIEKQIRSRFIEKLYLLRLEHYSDGFVITDKIQRRPEPKRIIDRDNLLEINQELYKWKSGTVSLIISPNSLAAFYELRDALSMGYAEQGRFSDAQVDKIFKSLANFRGALRSDLEIP